jgi:hypothetical protein
MIVQQWCDPHNAQDAKEPAMHTLVVQIDGSKLRRIDLCRECFDTLAAPLVPIVDEYGAAPEAPAAPPRHSAGGARPRPAVPRSSDPRPTHSAADVGTCPLCREEKRYLGIHLRQTHGLALDDSIERNKSGALVCPSCPETFTGAHGLAVHHKSSHGRPVMHEIADRVAASQKGGRRSS